VLPVLSQIIVPFVSSNITYKMGFVKALLKACVLTTYMPHLGYARIIVASNVRPAVKTKKNALNVRMVT
jgi:hypothetical protein